VVFGSIELVNGDTLVESRGSFNSPEGWTRAMQVGLIKSDLARGSIRQQRSIIARLSCAGSRGKTLPATRQALQETKLVSEDISSEDMVKTFRCSSSSSGGDGDRDFGNPVSGTSATGQHSDHDVIPIEARNSCLDDVRVSCL
jgi:hypothetical protein